MAPRTSSSLPRHLIRRHLCSPRPPSVLHPPRASSYISRGQWVLIPTTLWHSSPLSTSSTYDGSTGRDSSPPPVPPTWVVQEGPPVGRPYAMLARLDKPIGTWLLSWPCFWYYLLPTAAACVIWS
ncbi:hypothetical protein GUJ93_ZPchr0010g9096 [Zizania palustris]|uniref:Uncharacterized protein n=1 Tax=Zizania palustris TaxID=103762 RepID=A0A8J6BJU8_ZIZPA|nr:hypothetical protein GUJ93_ZPchr0010g9096 [Zizania palustris]